MTDLLNSKPAPAGTLCGICHLASRHPALPRRAATVVVDSSVIPGLRIPMCDEHAKISATWAAFEAEYAARFARESEAS